MASLLGMFGLGKSKEQAAAPAKATKNSPKNSPSKKKETGETNSSTSSIVKLDENGNPMESSVDDEEEEEPLYTPPVLHVYDNEHGGVHPDERAMPNPDRQKAHDEEKNQLSELSAKERKERHSADTKSSVNRNAGQKKGGAGGGFTWTGGEHGDGDIPEGYVPDQLKNQMQGVSVSEQKAEQKAATKNQEAFDMHKQTSKDFPPLGKTENAPPASPQKQHNTASWQQAVADDPNIKL